MKILIAGIGKVGETLAADLSADGNSVTLIDTESEILEAGIEAYDVMSVEGNCASMETLLEAGVETADLLIAATGKDEVNLLSCMTAHQLNSRIHTIVRLRNPEYLEQAYRMQESFGVSMVFNPEKQTAKEIERLLKFPGFLQRDSFFKGRVEIVECLIDKNSKLNGISLQGMNEIVKCRVLVCVVLREGEAIMPDGQFVLREGDKIFVTAPTEQLSLLLKNLGVVTRKNRRVMLAGGGTVAYYLAQELLKSHIDVQIVEQDEERCNWLSEFLPQASILQGNAAKQTLLESEGLSACDAFVTLTGTDERNMILSLYAQNRGVPQVITKVNRLEDSKILDTLALGSVVCPRSLSSEHIVRYVRGMRNQTGAAVAIHTLAEEQAEAMEFIVEEGTLHCGEPLRDIRLKKNTLLVSIAHGTGIEIPNGDSTFAVGDRVVVVVGRDSDALQLNDIFKY
ncbi:MAG: Trk system potassium transporter TrkA [Clostridia bacterium]|nr:Trk system potassium transporter TrkA [Clostridia bacterium]